MARPVEVLHLHEFDVVRIFDVMVEFRRHHRGNGFDRAERIDIDRFLDLDQLEIGGFEGGEIKPFFAAEVIISHAPVGAGEVGNILDAGGIETFGGKLLHRRLQNARTGRRRIAPFDRFRPALGFDGRSRRQSAAVCFGKACFRCRTHARAHTRNAVFTLLHFVKESQLRERCAVLQQNRQRPLT